MEEEYFELHFLEMTREDGITVIIPYFEDN